MEERKEAVRANRSEPMLSTFLNQRGVALGLPVSGNFELTARCNFNCKMCYVHLTEDQAALRGRELTAEQWLRIAREARDMGLIFLLLTGGEPFLREDFAYLYEELVKLGLMVSINTNASLYNEELRELFRKYPPTRINATLYGGSEETYANLCGNPSFGKVVNNLKAMKEDGLQVRLNVSLTPYNVRDLEQIDGISRELGLQAKASTSMYPPVRVDGRIGENAARFTPEEAGEYLAEWYRLRDSRETFRIRAEQMAKREDAGLLESCSDVEQEGVMCRAGRSSFWLTWDGRMLPCGTMDIEASYPLEVGFDKAWQEVRERTAAIRLPKECGGCPSRKNCPLCASICKGETGRFDGRPDYLCGMTEALRRHVLTLGAESEEEG